MSSDIVWCELEFALAFFLGYLLGFTFSLKVSGCAIVLLLNCQSIDCHSFEVKNFIFISLLKIAQYRLLVGDVCCILSACQFARLLECSCARAPIEGT